MVDYMVKLSKDTPQNRKDCICKKCPSHPDGCKEEYFYCGEGVGASKCDIKAKGCICPGCPVYARSGLDEIYFCDKAAAGESGLWMRKKGSREDDAFFSKVVDIKDLSQTGESVVRD